MLIGRQIRTAPLATVIILALTLTGASPLVPASAPWIDESGVFPGDLVGEQIDGVLAGGQQVGYSVRLEPGDYTFAAWAAWDLVSLELKVTGSDGAEIKKDEGLDNLPVVEFTLRDPETIRVVLTAGRERVPGTPGNYSFIVAHGWNNIDDASPQAKTLLDTWTMITWEEQSGIVWWDAMQITGMDSVIFNRTLPPGSYTLAVETVNQRDDIDMYVRLGDDTVIASDELPNNYPLCYFVLEGLSDIEIEIDPWIYGEGESTDVAIILAKDRESAL